MYLALRMILPRATDLSAESPGHKSDRQGPVVCEWPAGGVAQRHVIETRRPPSYPAPGCGVWDAPIEKLAMDITHDDGIKKQTWETFQISRNFGMDVSKNNGIPRSSILIGFSLFFGRYPYFWKLLILEDPIWDFFWERTALAFRTGDG